MTTDPHLEKLRDALQAYVHATDGETLIVTDFALGYAAIDMHTADQETWIETVAHGGAHSTLGLAHILTRDLTEGADE